MQFSSSDSVKGAQKSQTVIDLAPGDLGPAVRAGVMMRTYYKAIMDAIAALDRPLSDDEFLLLFERLHRRQLADFHNSYFRGDDEAEQSFFESLDEEEQGWSRAVDRVKTELRQKRIAFLFPSIDSLPKQIENHAIRFCVSAGGPLDILEEKEESPHQEQRYLYERIRRQIQRIKDTIPSQERFQIDAALDDFLDQPENLGDVKSKKVLWLCGNVLRRILAKHDLVQDQ
jgi:hypothetical protein